MYPLPWSECPEIPSAFNESVTVSISNQTLSNVAECEVSNINDIKIWGRFIAFQMELMLTLYYKSECVDNLRNLHITTRHISIRIFSAEFRLL